MPLIVLGALLQGAVGYSGASVQNTPQMKTPTSTTPEKDKCTVSGVVTSLQTGEPLKKATLHLTLRNTSRNTSGVFEQTGYSGTSGPDGSFKFESVEPGEYALSGEKPGYIRTSYGSKNGMTGGTMINLSTGQQLTDLKMQLVAQATITGRVLDDDGDPVSGVMVQALGRMFVQGGKARYFPRGSGNTDDTGSYRIHNLTPGKYYILAQSNRNQMMGLRERPAEPGKPVMQPVRTFYPSSLDRTGASALDLKAGQEMPGVDIRQRSLETFHIRGKVAGDLPETEGRMNMLTIMPNDSGEVGMMYNNMTMIAKDHTFDIANVAPGTYIITMPNFNGGKQTARQSVEVSSGDVNDVVITPQQAFVIHGAVELQGKLSGNAKDKALESIYVTLQPDDVNMMMGATQATTKADGSFTLETVVPSKYRVNVYNEPDGAYVKSIRFGSQETLGKTLDLSQAGGGELHVMLGAGAAEVTGTVMKQQDSSATSSSNSASVPVSGASVILIPEDLTRNGGSVHRAGTNQNGGFDEKGLTPGVYYALAFEADEYRSFDDPAILKQLVDKGTRVEVKENDKQQLQVTLTPAEEIQAALAASGVDN